MKKTEDARKTDSERRWPTHLFNGRVRTSTAALVIAFAGVWWVYDTYRAEPTPPPAPQVVPPGFIPDPAYTWVPRTRLQQPPATVTETFTPTPTTTESPTTEPPPGEPSSPTPVPGFPFCPPLCPPAEQPEPSAPPGVAPTTSAPPTSSAPPVAPPHSASPGPTTSHAAVP